MYRESSGKTETIWPIRLVMFILRFSGVTDGFTFTPDVYFFFNVYLFLRERETDGVQVGEGQRERETHSLKQAPGSELSAQSLMQGSNSRTVRS